MTPDEKKRLRTDLGQCLQVELNYCHVDYDKLEDLGYNLDSLDIEDEMITREDGISLFNQLSEQKGLDPLRNPLGYMKVEDNVYDVLRDLYTEHYEDQLEKIDNGQAMGSPVTMEVILDNLSAKVTKDTRRLIPETMKYQDLYHLAVSDDLEETMTRFVKQRVIYTSSWSIRRSLSKDALDRQRNLLKDRGEDLKKAIGEELQLVQEDLDAEFLELQGDKLNDLQGSDVSQVL